MISERTDENEPEDHDEDEGPAEAPGGHLSDWRVELVMATPAFCVKRAMRAPLFTLSRNFSKGDY